MQSNDQGRLWSKMMQGQAGSREGRETRKRGVSSHQMEKGGRRHIKGGAVGIAKSYQLTLITEASQRALIEIQRCVRHTSKRSGMGR